MDSTSIVSLVFDLLKAYVNLFVGKAYTFIRPKIAEFHDANPQVVQYIVLAVAIYLSTIALISTTRMFYRTIVSIIRTFFYLASICLLAWMYLRGLPGVTDDLKGLAARKDDFKNIYYNNFKNFDYSNIVTGDWESVIENDSTQLWQKVLNTGLGYILSNGKGKDSDNTGYSYKAPKNSYQNKRQYKY